MQLMWQLCPGKLSAYVRGEGGWLGLAGPWELGESDEELSGHSQHTTWC